jgi:hypothetical protein
MNTSSPQSRRAIRAPKIKTLLALCLLLAATFAVVQASAANRKQSGGTLSATITSAPSGQTTDTTAKISFTTNRAQKVQCSLDGKSFASCSSPVSYSGLAVGGHVFVVQAIRNGTTASATASWAVVSAVPASFTVSSSIATGATLTGRLKWEATPSKSVTKVEFSIDGTLRWTEGYAPYVFNGDGNSLDTTTLTDGSHTLKIVAYASDGTTAQVTAGVQVQNAVAPTPAPAPAPAPTFSIASSIADGSTLSGAVSWEATPSASATKVEFSIDDALGWTEGYAPYVFNGDGNTLDTATLANGSHTLKVVAYASDGTTAEKTVSVGVQNSASAPAPAPAPAPTPTPGAAGNVLFMGKTSSSTDPYTNSPTTTTQQWFADKWDRALTYSSYWDSRISWFPNAWGYADAYAIYTSSSLVTQHPEWILKDSIGTKLYIPWGCSGGTCPQYAADIGNPAWQQNYINGVKTLAAKGYKGVFVDDVDMDINVGNGLGQSVAPVDPRTGLLMTDTVWKSYFAQFMEQLRAAVPGMEIVHNAVWFAGGGLHDASNPYIAREMKAADYIDIERGLNDSGLTGGTGSWSVYAVMRYVDRVHSYGAHVIYQSYAQDATAAEYNLSGYLLTNDGGDYVSTTGVSLPGQWWSGYDTNLGDALGARYLWNGVWRRDFTGGIVLLNEPGSTTKTLDLGGTFRNTSGQSVTSVTLSASRGAVLAR